MGRPATLACALLLASACSRAGSDGAPGQPAATLTDVLQQACDRGVARSCNDLGIAWFEGRGGAKDPARAAAAYRKACELRDAVGCVNLGVMLLNGQGIPADAGAASGYFRLGCDAGDLAGCTNLGLLLREGRGVPRDEAGGNELLLRVCRSGFHDACRLLARPEGG
jgi:hypothetical protein